MTAAPRSPRQKRRTDLTRSRLLDASLAVMTERGYEATSLAEITQRADLGTGTLYLHFRDKRSLYEALVRREVGVVYQQWLEAEAKAPSKDPIEAIRSVIRVSLESFLANPRKAQLILFEGPDPEAWIAELATENLAAVIGGPAPELLARLVIGAGLSACRWAIHHAVESREAATLVDVAVTFCAAGLAEVSSTIKKKPPQAKGRTS